MNAHYLLKYNFGYGDVYQHITSPEEDVAYLTAAVLCYGNLDDIPTDGVVSSPINKMQFLQHLQRKEWREAVECFNTASASSCEVLRLPPTSVEYAQLPPDIQEDIPRQMEQLLQPVNREWQIILAEQAAMDTELFEAGGENDGDFPVETVIIPPPADKEGA